MKRRRRFTGATRYSPVTEHLPRAELEGRRQQWERSQKLYFAEREPVQKGWDYRYTLERITRDQPPVDQYIQRQPRTVAAVRKFSAQQLLNRWYLEQGFNQHTGEIHDIAKVRKDDTRNLADRDPSDCHAHRDDRRHHIIAGGHGGKNGFTVYKPHKEC